MVLKCNSLLKTHCTMTAEVVLAMMDVSDGDKRGEVKMGDLTMSWKWMTPTNPFSKTVTMTLATCHLCKLRKRDEGFPDRSRVCTQTSPSNNTTAANGPNCTIPPTIAAKPIQPNTNSGNDCTTQPTSWSSTLHPVHPLVLLFQFLNLRCTLLLTIKIADC